MASNNFLCSKILLAFTVILFITPINSSTWNTFKISHILDPGNPECTNYHNWDKENWMTWLNARDELDRIERGSKANPRPLISKGINSVIISSPENVKASFADHDALVMFKSDPRGNKYWSKDKFLIYTFKKQKNKPHEVYRCKEFYFVAVLSRDGEPVHFDACGRTVEENYPGNYQFPWKDCTKLF